MNVYLRITLYHTGVAQLLNNYNTAKAETEIVSYINSSDTFHKLFLDTRNKCN